jgi:poly(3-hydroxybutyrate) depolymerase
MIAKPAGVIRSLLICLSCLIACGQDAFAEMQARTVTHDGKERTYHLTAPKTSPGEKLPLVIALHFYPGGGRAMAGLTGFSALAEREGFLVAYPEGLNGGFNALMCCGAEDDVGFVRALIEDIGKTYAVDADRTYATGISNGGDLTYRLAAELARRVRGDRAGERGHEPGLDQEAVRQSPGRADIAHRLPRQARPL